MDSILIAGSGKIGSTIAQLLINSGDYRIVCVDIKQSDNNQPHIQHIVCDLLNRQTVEQVINETKVNTLISCLPYHLTVPLAHIACDNQLNYLDLTEDVSATKIIKTLAKKSNKTFIAQCGLAPGFINIVAQHLMQQFDSIDEVKLRCGALPQSTSNALQYTLTWSTDGLINEYANLCQVIANGQTTMATPLADLEEIQIDGNYYEAFNTSGGIGSLIDTYAGKVNNMNYKSIRYPGHCDRMQFLMQGLKLSQDRETLKRILERAIPATVDDVVIIYVAVIGKINHQFIRKAYVKKCYPKIVDNIQRSAIQMSTASGVCAVLDIMLNQPDQYTGYLHQEDFNLDTIVSNRFGQYFADKIDR